MAKSVAVTVKNLENGKTTRLMFSFRVNYENVPMVFVSTKDFNYGAYKVSRFGDGKNLSRQWVRDFLSDSSSIEIVKWG